MTEIYVFAVTEGAGQIQLLLYDPLELLQVLMSPAKVEPDGNHNGAPVFPKPDLVPLTIIGVVPAT